MYRSLNSKQRDVMIQCLLMANHQKKEWEWQGDPFICERGQFITSLDSITRNCGDDVKMQSVRTALLKLERWGFLTNKSTKTGRLISICNWDAYQSNDGLTNKDANRQLTKLQQSSNKALTPNKKGKNDKKGKRESTSKARPHSLSEVLEFCQTIDLPKTDAEATWNKWEGNGHKNAGKAMRCWKSTILSWKGNGYMPSQKQHQGNTFAKGKKETWDAAETFRNKNEGYDENGRKIREPQPKQ